MGDLLALGLELAGDAGEGGEFVQRHGAFAPAAEQVEQVHVPVVRPAEVIHAFPRLVGPAAELRRRDAVDHGALEKDLQVRVERVVADELGLAAADALEELREHRGLRILGGIGRIAGQAEQVELHALLGRPAFHGGDGDHAAQHHFQEGEGIRLGGAVPLPHFRDHGGILPVVRQPVQHPSGPGIRRPFQVERPHGVTHGFDHIGLRSRYCHGPTRLPSRGSPARECARRALGGEGAEEPEHGTRVGWAGMDSIPGLDGGEQLQRKRACGGGGGV